MQYAALITREYGQGRACIVTDRLGGYMTGHGPVPERFWRNLLQWTAQKNNYEHIRVGVLDYTVTNFEQRIAEINNVSYKTINLQDIGLNLLGDIDIICFIGLPQEINQDIQEKIASFINNGGGILNEVPDAKGKINIFQGIDDISCYQYVRPLYLPAFWTSHGKNSYLYDSNAVVKFLTSIVISEIPSGWSIEMSSIETSYSEDTEETYYDLDIAGETGSSFLISYIGGMQKGVLEIDEQPSEITESSSSDSSSSSSSSYEDFMWDFCDDIIAHWKLNENNNNSFVWDSSGDFNQMGTLYEDLIQENTSNVYVDSMLNGAFNLNGVNHRIEIPSGNKLNFSDGSSDDPFVASLWIIASDLSSHQVLLHKEDSWKIYIENQRVYFSLIDGASEKTAYSYPVLNNVKCFIMTKYNGSTPSIIINGRDETETVNDTGYNVMGNTNSPLYIGCDKNISNFYAGIIDDIQIFEINAPWYMGEVLYNQGLGTMDCFGEYIYTSSSESSSSSSSSSSSIA